MVAVYLLKLGFSLGIINQPSKQQQRHFPPFHYYYIVMMMLCCGATFSWSVRIAPTIQMPGKKQMKDAL